MTRFAALAATKEGSAGVQFRVDYLNWTGAIGFYYPDWVLVQRPGANQKVETPWIVETKGREYPGAAEKDRAMADWCERASAATGDDSGADRIVTHNVRDFREAAARFGIRAVRPRDLLGG